jgi:hypothetical protein
MIYYTKYAESKFEILNKYHVFLRKEEVDEAVVSPDKCEAVGNYQAACKGKVKVVYKQEGEVVKVITFYPIKNS